MKANAILTENGEEIANAEKLGMNPPERKTKLCPIVFYKSDIKRAQIFIDGTIIITFNDNEYCEIELS